MMQQINILNRQNLSDQVNRHLVTILQNNAILRNLRERVSIAALTVHYKGKDQLGDFDVDIPEVLCHNENWKLSFDYETEGDAIIFYLNCERIKNE